MKNNITKEQILLVQKLVLRDRIQKAEYKRLGVECDSSKNIDYIDTRTEDEKWFDEGISEGRIK